MHPLNSLPSSSLRPLSRLFFPPSFNLRIFRSFSNFPSLSLDSSLFNPSRPPSPLSTVSPFDSLSLPFSFSHVQHECRSCISLFASLPLRPSAARRKKLVSGTRELIRFYGLHGPGAFQTPLAATSGFQLSRLPATGIADPLRSR